MTNQQNAAEILKTWAEKRGDAELARQFNATGANVWVVSADGEATFLVVELHPYRGQAWVAKNAHGVESLFADDVNPVLA